MIQNTRASSLPGRSNYGSCQWWRRDVRERDRRHGYFAFWASWKSTRKWRVRESLLAFS